MLMMLSHLDIHKGVCYQNHVTTTDSEMWNLLVVQCNIKVMSIYSQFCAEMVSVLTSL